MLVINALSSLTNKQSNSHESVHEARTLTPIPSRPIKSVIEHYVMADFKITANHSTEFT